MLAGPDARDPISCLARAPSAASSAPLRIAWSPDWGRLAVDPEVRSATAAAASVFERLGHHVELGAPAVGDAFEILGPIVAADTQVLLEREGLALSDLSADAAAEVELLGTPPLTEYVRALHALTKFRQAVDAFFERFDLMLTPATAVPAFPLAEPPAQIEGRSVDPRWTTFMPLPGPLEPRRPADRVAARRAHQRRPSGRRAGERTARPDWTLLRVMRGVRAGGALERRRGGPA